MNGPGRLTPIIASQSPSWVWSKGLECRPVRTALLTRTSRLPWRSTARAATRSQSCLREISVATNSQVPPLPDEFVGRLAAGQRIAAYVSQEHNEPIDREPMRHRSPDT